MKCNSASLIRLVAPLILTVAPAAGETPTRTTRPPAVVSPEIHSDGKVTFRLSAPKAAEVILAGQWANGRSAMSRDSNGVWSASVGPIDAGVWEYSFQVDGMSMIDPANPAIKPMRSPRTSILHLPGQPPLNHDLRDVPHGTLHLHTYTSKSLARSREMVVYTPPGYELNGDSRYPVLWLQHGMGDNQSTWTVHGKAHWILDNLVAQNRAKPMLIVMLDGHAAQPGPEGFTNNTLAFERDLLQDAMPFFERIYRVKTDAASRAIVGLSMGGNQSLTIGLNHADLFAWVGGFSAAVPNRDSVAAALDNPDVLNSKLKLLWIGCGRNDFLLQRNQEFVALLNEKGLRHECHVTDGDHSWPVWRRYLVDLAPRLFQ